MASRRLAISSLLCDDDTPPEPVVEPVVLAPHLKNLHRAATQVSAQSNSFHPRPSTSPYPPISIHLAAHQDAHQDTHQSSSSSHRPSSSHHTYNPVHSPPPQHQLPFLGLEALVHAATEERRRLSAGSSADQDTPHLTSPLIHESLHRSHQRSHHRSPSRQPTEQYSRPFERSATVSPPYEYRIQSPSYSPQLNSQLPHHRTHDRSLPDDQVQIRPVNETHRPVYFPPQPPPPTSSHPDHDSLIQQLELIRQRQHHEQLLLKEQQQQRQLARERQLAYPNPSTSPTIPPRVPSMPLHLQLPSASFSKPQLSPHVVPRNSDPDQVLPMISQKIQTHPTSAHLNHILSPNSSVPDDTSFYPTKKRRYSDSPNLPISSEEQERLSPDRGKTATADMGYQRIDPQVVPIPPRSPTQPASALERKPTAVAEPVMPDREKERGRIHIGAVEGQRDGQGLLKPAGRRVSPGSQAGKAMAARKSEETDVSLGSKDRTSERGRHRIPEDRQMPGEERKRSHTRPAGEVQTVEGSVSRIKEAHEVIRRPRLPTPPPTKSQDAHEWFLEHYDDVPSHPVSDESAAPPRVPPPIPPHTVSVASSSKKRMSTPVTMPEAAVALEQELEELVVNSPTIPSKIEPNVDVDMDVDLAVTELVAETLEPDVPHVGMEVDVEDELLSLVDDRPSMHHTSRRTSGPTTSAMPMLTTKNLFIQATSNSDAQQDSPSVVSAVSNVSLPGNFSPVIRSSSARPSERGSMPPPASVTPARGERAGSVTATAPTAKKKDGTSKAAAKSRAKLGPKPKTKDADNVIVPPAPAKSAKTSATPAVKKATGSRSRSTSTMPGGSVGPEGDPKAEKQEEEEESDGHEGDKLYCVCKTKYDEDRFMIACDRCDEWYHTQCVNMPDLEVDLVDQFICPPCVEQNPHLFLHTTYKRRCLFGLKHADPDSVKACHKPARGAFSKYCSDECGVKYMQTRLDAWAKKGGKKDKLWESVKNAEKREGIVVSADDGIFMKREGEDDCKREEVEIKPRKGKVERELERLNGLLDQVVKLREEIKKGVEVVVWREKLIELASERAEQVDQCGWDQRLCFGDDEWADFGAGVLESYEDVKAESNQGDMQVDGVSEDLGEWWCPGKKMCDRHAGWQVVRQKDVCQEKEKKEDALSNLTTREREIRKRIEDIVDPQSRNCADSDKAGAKIHTAKQANGSSGGKTHTGTSKKGKKRKAPS